MEVESAKYFAWKPAFVDQLRQRNQALAGIASLISSYEDLRRRSRSLEQKNQGLQDQLRSTEIMLRSLKEQNTAREKEGVVSLLLM